MAVSAIRAFKPRAFAVLRVSTAGRAIEHRMRKIEAAGFRVEPHRVVAETDSGSHAIARRGEVLVVIRLDRLGRDAMGAVGTVARLEAAGVRIGDGVGRPRKAGACDVPYGFGRSAGAVLKLGLDLNETHGPCRRCVAHGRTVCIGRRGTGISYDKVPGKARTHPLQRFDLRDELVVARTGVTITLKVRPSSVSPARVA